MRPRILSTFSFLHLRIAGLASLLLVLLADHPNLLAKCESQAVLEADATGDESSDSPKEIANPMLPVRLRVVDADGQPVEGASIAASGLRTKLEPGSHYRWVESRHGKLPTAVSDAEATAGPTD